jgi:hypothetical protein
MDIVDEGKNLTDSWAATRAAWAAPRESWIASRELWAKTLQASAKNQGLCAAKREYPVDAQPAARRECRQSGMFGNPDDSGKRASDSVYMVF